MNVRGSVSGRSVMAGCGLFDLSGSVGTSSWCWRRVLNTAQGLFNFMTALGGGIGPAAVAGLSGIVLVRVALAVLAALPLAGLVLSLTRRPGASRRPEPDQRGSRR